MVRGRGSWLDGDLRFEAVNFADGGHSVVDIAMRLEAEFARDVSWEDLFRYFEDLASLGLVELETSSMERFIELSEQEEAGAGR